MGEHIVRFRWDDVAELHSFSSPRQPPCRLQLNPLGSQAKATYSSFCVQLLQMIHGLVVRELRQIRDERGRVMHMLRADSSLFTRFGEIYFSVVNPGVVKAWRSHRRTTQHFAVPMGTIRLVVYDGRASAAGKGKIEVLELGEDNYRFVTIPPLVWYGFKAVSPSPALVANCMDYPYDPDEVSALHVFTEQIPYDWGTDLT